MKTFSKQLIFFLLINILTFSVFSSAFCAESLKPFVLASISKEDMATAINTTKESLTTASFKIIGEYSPYETAHVIVVTNDALLKNAIQSDMGGFGAVQRVSLTKVGDEIQISFTNPVYMANVYRMKESLSEILESLKTILGFMQEHGSEKGLTAAKLRKYHYMFSMPYFDDPFEFAKFGNYDEAVTTVTDNLSKGKGGSSQVYRLDLPGKNITLFGVGLTGKPDECSGDAKIMKGIDGNNFKGTAHLPYEIMVVENRVISLHPKFRIAQSFPDLSMVAGDYTFFNIMCAPGAIKESFELLTAK